MHLNILPKQRALEPVDRNDLGDHGYIEGHLENGRLKTNFVPFACRSYVTAEEFKKLDWEGRMDWRFVEGEKRYQARFAETLLATHARKYEKRK